MKKGAASERAKSEIINRKYIGVRVPKDFSKVLFGSRKDIAN